MNTKLYLIIGLIVSTCALQGLQAQQKWTLEQCVEKAVSSSINVSRSELNIQNAQISMDLAKQARYPFLSGNANLNWNFGRSIDPTTNGFITERFFSNNYSLNSGVVIFNGFRIKNNIAKSALDYQAAEADTKQLELDLSLQVALTYLNVVFEKENIEIAKKQLNLNEQQLVRIQKSINAGALAASEDLNIKAQIANNQQNIVVAQNRYELALFQLKQALRIDVSTEIEVVVPEDIDLIDDLDNITYEQLLKESLKQRYDLLGAKYRAESSELAIDIAKSGYYPTLSLGGSLNTYYSNQALEVIGQEPLFVVNDFVINNMDVEVGQFIDRPITSTPGFLSQLDNFLSYGFGLQLNVPIYNNGITDGNVQRAQINVENQKLNKAELSEALQLTIHQALTDAKAAKRKLAASEVSLNAQEAAFENVSKRLKLGAANSFEWETQKTNLENAEITKLLDKYDYIFKVKVVEFYLGKKIKL